jgi:DNA-binding MarR family transcriptional regulator
LTRLDPPDRLATRFATTASTWQRILGVDASAHAIFGRVSALALRWAALHRETLHGFGINYAELAVLSNLRTSEPGRRRSPTELRVLIGQSSAGMTRILDKLEADGHLRREDIAGDRRRVDIVLTESGAELAERGVAALLEVQAQVLELVAPEDRNMITNGLDVLLAALGASSK